MNLNRNLSKKSQAIGCRPVKRWNHKERLSCRQDDLLKLLARGGLPQLEDATEPPEHGKPSASPRVLRRATYDHVDDAACAFKYFQLALLLPWDCGSRGSKTYISSRPAEVKWAAELGGTVAGHLAAALPWKSSGRSCAALSLEEYRYRRGALGDACLWPANWVT